MKRTRHDAKALLPLLESIRRELEERRQTLDLLERRLTESTREDERRALAAEAVQQRRELVRCHAELERLGCSVLGTMPLTIRIQTQEGSTRGSVVWQHGQDPHW